MTENDASREPDATPPQGWPAPPPPPAGSSTPPYPTPAPQPPASGAPAYGAPAYGAPVYGAPAYGPPPVQGEVAQAHTGLVTIPGLGTAKLATIGQRALARIVDGVLITVVIAVLWGIGFGALIAGTDETTGEANGLAVGAFFGIFLLTVLITLAYEMVLIAIKGQTVGKMVVGVKVVRSQDGQVPGFGPSFMRWLIPAAASAVCGLGIVVYLSPLFDSSGRVQGWHDKAANTLVISTK